MKFIPLERTETPALFETFLGNFEKVRPFYRYDYRRDMPEVILERAAFATPRAEMAKILSAQNRGWGAPTETLASIEKLRSPKTLAVVTGQQAGVLGGPLYTFYKAMTVLRMTRQLSQKYPEYAFIPVFWMEVNDSDFQEIATLRYIDKGNALKSLTLPQLAGNEDRPIAVRAVHSEIGSWHEMLGGDFFDTEFKTEALSLFLDAYQEGKTYPDAFASMLLKVFGKHGLILLNPAGRDICQFVKPLFQRALTESEAILKAVVERRKMLEVAGYSSQIHFNHNQTLLFFNDAGQRRVRIDIDDSGNFQLKYPEGYRPAAQELLLESCRESPEYISPNVALRPLMQDYILPTVAYVGGPSEIAYFAQVEALYHYFDMPMPAIVPRHRLSIVEGKIQKHVEKFSLNYGDILENRPDFIERQIKNSANQSLFDAIGQTDTTIYQALDKLEKQLEKADPTLVNTLKKTSEGIRGNFQKLSGKIIRSLEQQNETQVRQLERILLSLLPGGNYQERTLGMIYFTIKYGNGFIDELLEALPPETDHHWVVEL